MPEPVHTDRLIIRSFEPDDFEAMFEYYRLPETAVYLYWEAMTAEETRAKLKLKLNQTTLKEDGDVLSLAVWSLEHQTLIGDLSMALRSKMHRQAEIGFIFNPRFGGNGYATEAAHALMGLGFNEFEFHRLYGRCDARNKASWGLMERLGMRREAHFKQNEIFKGEWGEEFWYAMLKDEYAGVTKWED